MPALNAWIFWWNAEQFNQNLSPYWDAPIFYPVKGTLAFSEPQPIALFAAPLIWCFGTVCGYTVWLTVQLLMNGLAAAWLLRSLRLGIPVSLLGSVVILGLPIVWENIDSLQLVALWPILGCIGYAYRLRVKPTYQNALGLGCALVFACATSVHQFCFFAVCSVPAFIWLLPRPLKAQWFKAVGLSSILAISIIALIAWPMIQIHRQQGFVRHAQTQAALSATMTDWLSTDSPRALNPGWVCSCLALFAIACAVCLRNGNVGDGGAAENHIDRRMIGFLATLAASSLLFSFGHNLRVGSTSLWPLVNYFVPPLAAARSLFRFAYFTQLTIVLLMAFGVEYAGRMVWLRLESRGWRQVSRWGCVILLAIAVSIGLYKDVPRRPVRLLSTVSLNPEPGWARRLRQIDPGSPILCLPFAEGLTSQGLEWQSRWMLFATIHRHPLFNGYSGFFPAAWYENLQRFAMPPLTTEALGYLTAQGVSIIVVDRRRYDFPGIDRRGTPVDFLSIGPYRLTLVDSQGTIEIWQLSSPKSGS